jgi:hypothetical protein
MIKKKLLNFLNKFNNILYNKNISIALIILFNTQCNQCLNSRKVRSNFS